jgi:hypothetical protein
MTDIPIIEEPETILVLSPDVGEKGDSAMRDLARAGIIAEETPEAMAEWQQQPAIDAANEAAEKIEETEAVRAATEEVRVATDNLRAAMVVLQSATESARLEAIDAASAADLKTAQTEAVRAATEEVRAATAALQASVTQARDAAAAAANDYQIRTGTFDAQIASALSASTIAQQSEASALIAAANAQALTNVARAGGLAYISHKFMDEASNLLGGIANGGRDFFLAKGLIRLEDRKVSFLWGSKVAGATTPAITDNGDGTVLFGVGALGMRINPVAGSVTIAGLAVDGASLNRVGPALVGTFTGGAMRLKGDDGTVYLHIGNGKVALGAWAFTDDGRIYRPDRSEFKPSPAAATTFTADYIKAKSQAAYNEVARIRARRVNPLKGRSIVPGFNLVKSTGQSNSNGTQSFPAILLSTTILGRTHGGLMIGNSVHTGNETATTWAPIGAAALNPLVATVCDEAGGLLNQAGQYALDPSAGNRGETPMEGAVAVMDWLRLRDLGLTSSSTKFICYSAGVGGKKMAEVSKGASPDLYNRLVSGAAAAAALTGPGLNNCATILSNGEADGSAGTPAATVLAQYRALRTDEHADITVGICGDAPGSPRAPLFIIQTSARGIANPGGLVVANAQLEMALTDDDVFIVAGYRGTKKGIHFDVNTNRWTAQRLGYLMYQRLVLNQLPIPFAPYEVEVSGNQMLITFLVPTPPLQFANAYDVTGSGLMTDASAMQAFQNVDKGLKPFDGAGDLTVSAVTIYHGNTIVIDCARAFNTATPCKVDYGRRTAPLGAGNLIDSTDFQFFSHSYAAGRGQSLWESVPAYANQPFPPGHDCCLFTRTATAV